MADEVVALLDESGAVIGAVPRSVMRRDNLWHAASSVVVHDGPLGTGTERIYLHRRTESKDLYPGLLDFAAGGVLLAGEDPLAGATREVAEELGVTGRPLVPQGVVAYADAHTRHHAHRFVVQWDGPVVWQPEEVAWGGWVAVSELSERIERDPEAFMPDTVAVWRDALGEWLAAGSPPA